MRTPLLLYIYHIGYVYSQNPIYNPYENIDGARQHYPPLVGIEPIRPYMPQNNVLNTQPLQGLQNYTFHQSHGPIGHTPPSPYTQNMLTTQSTQNMPNNYMNNSMMSHHGMHGMLPLLSPQNLNTINQIAMDIANCDPKTQGVCCVMKEYCDINATCSSDAVPETLLDIINTIPVCKCNWGFEGDGKTNGTGCKNINECETGEAGCEQICRDFAPGYACGCYDGYTLLNNGKSCQDVNECLIQNGKCQHLCINTLGSYTCKCAPGFELANDGHNCIESNLCRVQGNTKPCDQLCESKLGVLKCHCIAGYKLNPKDLKSCIDRDECIEGLDDGSVACAKDGSQVCINTLGSYMCTCAKGFKLSDPPKSVDHIKSGRRLDTNLSLSDGKETEIDAMKIAQMAQQFFSAASAAGKAIQGFQKISGATNVMDQQYRQYQQQAKISKLASSKATLGTAKDRFVPFESWSDQMHQIVQIQRQILEQPRKIPNYREPLKPIHCVDVNECQEISLRGDKPCPIEDQVCINTPGSYSCQCPIGYTPDFASKKCVDLDECNVPNQTNITDPNTNILQGYENIKPQSDQKRPCDQICVNTEGSFHCKCHKGYKLSDTGDCQDIDECKNGTHGCSHDCVNLPGTYACKCKPGYTFNDPAQHICADIDECRTQKHNCTHDCHNTLGSYFCTCPGDLELASDRHSCIKRKTCFENPHLCKGDHVCTLDTNTEEWVCKCPNGFREIKNQFSQVTKCIDIDECTVGYPNLMEKACKDPERPCCLNIAGGFQCLPWRGWDSQYSEVLKCY